MTPPPIPLLQEYKREQAMQSSSRSRIPGYSGYVQGASCVDGATFGRMSRMDAEQNMRSYSNALPSEPNRANSPSKKDEGARS